MKNESENFIRSVDRYLSGEASEAAQAQLERAYEHALLKYKNDEVEKLAANANLIGERNWKQLIQRVHQSEKINKRLWTRIWTAAAVLVFMLSSALWIIYINRSDNDRHNIYANDVKPGKNGAMLTLSDGRKIKLHDLSNGHTLIQGNIIIAKSAKGILTYKYHSGGTVNDGSGSRKVNTLSTGVGETFNLRLSDGSSVTLNSASSLIFPVDLNTGAERIVDLKGEGFFNVSKNPKRPFIVKTGIQKVKVLGTHFNINNYSNEQFTTTTLLQGSVQVTNISNAEQVTLKPGQQSLVMQGRDIMTNSANIKSVMAWKNGYFRFNQERIDVIMQTLSRWYPIEIIYEGDLPEEKFSGVISRNGNISAVLNMLSYSKAVRFKVEGRRVTVMK